jgi:CheY-like chemotaxis protein
MDTPARILVVDDEAGIRFYLEEALTRYGYEVLAVDSGEAALQCIAAEKFDLALIDLKMKEVGGIEVLTSLRLQAPDTGHRAHRLWFVGDGRRSPASGRPRLSVQAVQDE